MLNYHRFMGFYYTPYWMALLGMRGLVHGPRSKQNNPAQIEPRQRYRQIVRCVLYGPGPWLLVHGPRQDGPGTTGQV